MPTLNIKDPVVYRLARELAERRGMSMTAVIRQALEAAQAADRASARATLAEILAIGRRSAARPEPFLDARELYDEQGLPR